MSYPSNGAHRNSARKKRMHYSPNLLSCITNAVDSKKLVEIEYDSRESGITSRQVEPMALIYKNRKRHMVGYCHLRDDWRTFRLDRIALIKLLKDDFSPREDFEISQFEEEYVNSEHNEPDEYDDEED